VPAHERSRGTWQGTGRTPRVASEVAAFFDDTSRTFLVAHPGAVGYAPIELKPGTYAYMCWVNQGGKRNGKPHAMLGTNGTFTVS
jgi:hypothetical protein